MTDQLAAAVALAATRRLERIEVLLGKYYESAGNELVVNKWFALQASADADDALCTVKKLVAHQAFSRTNPNRYRAVVPRSRGPT